MMKTMRRGVRLFGAVALAAVPLLAAEFWERKPFADWDRNEVRRMLTRSPWAQQTFVGLDAAGTGYGPTGGLEAPQAGGPAVAAPGGFPPSVGPGGLPQDAGGAGVPSQGQRSEPFGPASPEVIVRWHSAVPIKQALVRSSASGGALTEAARRFLEPETEYYIVSVSGLPATAVQAMLDPARLARAATLKRKGRAPLRPEKAAIEAEAASVGLFFYFCRSREITLADREVEFTLDLPELRLSRKFKLSGMVFNGKLQL